jgi:glycosyltransferase involved in cell wall biosynthesis
MTSLNYPYISIIIPVYNRKDKIQSAIESVLKQTFTNFEIIIVDDGSTDGLGKILALYSDSRVRVLKHSKNKGASAARNTGIKEATGDLIAFLDSDDVWVSEKLEKQISHFNGLRERNESIKGSFTWFFLHRQNGSVILRKFKNVKNWKKYFLEGCFISPGSTLLIDKSVYKHIGFYDESLNRLEDWDWLLRFSKKFNLVTYEIPLSHIYQGERPPYKSVLSSFQKILKKYRNELSFCEKAKLISNGHIELYSSCRRTSFLKAHWHFSLAILMNPFLLKRAWRNKK